MDGSAQDAIVKAIKLQAPTVHLITSEPEYIAAQGAAVVSWGSNMLETG